MLGHTIDINGKDRQDGIANKAQNFAAIRDYGPSCYFEIVVQDREEFRLRDRPCQRCRAKQVAESDDGVDLLTVAQLYLTLQDTVPGAATQISVQDVVRGLFFDGDLAGDGQALLDAH